MPSVYSEVSCETKEKITTDKTKNGQKKVGNTSALKKLANFTHLTCAGHRLVRISKLWENVYWFFKEKSSNVTKHRSRSVYTCIEVSVINVLCCRDGAKVSIVAFRVRSERVSRRSVVGPEPGRGQGLGAPWTPARRTRCEPPGREYPCGADISVPIRRRVAKRSVLGRADILRVGRGVTASALRHSSGARTEARAEPRPERRGRAWPPPPAARRPPRALAAGNPELVNQIGVYSFCGARRTCRAAPETKGGARGARRSLAHRLTARCIAYGVRSRSARTDPIYVPIYSYNSAVKAALPTYSNKAFAHKSIVRNSYVRGSRPLWNSVRKYREGDVICV